MIHRLLDQIQPDASDDEDGPSSDIDFNFTGAADGDVAPEKCRAVIVCGAGAASAFALSSFPLRPLGWKLEQRKESTASRAFPPPPKTPRFFAVGDGHALAAVALLDGGVPDDLAMAWAECLLNALPEAQEVVVMDRIFRAEWANVGRGRPEEPHLCGLWTAGWGSAGPSCASGADSSGRLSLLPVPNVVQGLGAALLSQCEAERRRCLVALSLQDGAHLGEGCLRAFEGLAPLLREMGALPPGSKPPNYGEAVRKVVPPASMSIYA